MARYIVGRVLQAVAVLWAAFTVAFLILYLLPSDPVKLQLGAAGIDEDSLTPAQVADLKHQFGLDQSLWAQYWHRLAGALHGDFGTSLTQHTPVTSLISQRIGQTLLLAVVAGALLASVATFVRLKPLRIFLSRLPALGASFPQFFIALLLIQFFSFDLGWFPATGTQGFGSLVMPAITIALLTSALLAQVLIKSFEETLRQPYIVTARAKGLSRSAVHLRPVFRNAALPAVTLLGVLGGLPGT